MKKNTCLGAFASVPLPRGLCLGVMGALDYPENAQ